MRFRALCHSRPRRDAHALGAVTNTLGAVTSVLGIVTIALGAVTIALGAVTNVLGIVTIALGAVTNVLGIVTIALGAVTNVLGAVTIALGACIRSPHNMKAPNAAALGTPQIHNEYFFHNEPHNDAPSVSVHIIALDHR